jgi:hypothetical protein
LNKQYFASLIFCFFAGIASGLLSLIILTLVTTSPEETSLNQSSILISIVFFEEVSKLILLWWLFDLIEKKIYLSAAFFLALGFSSLETLLILFGKNGLNFSIILVFLVHFATFFSWLWALHFFRKNKSLSLAFLLSSFAFGLHFFYNLFALEYF